MDIDMNIEKILAAKRRYGDMEADILHAFIVDKILPYLHSVGLVVLPEEAVNDLSLSPLPLPAHEGGEPPLLRLGNGEFARDFNPPKPEPVALYREFRTLLKHAWRTR